MDKIFIDIETVKGVLNISAEDIAAPSNYKDATKIAEYRQKKIKELEAKAGLNSFTAKICCISWAINDEPVRSLYGINEQKIIEDFNELIPNNLLEWIGYNILSFDLPMLYHRAIKYKAYKVKALMPQDSRNRSFDVMKKLAPTDYKAMFKLDDACKYFGIKTPKDKMQGNEVQAYYEAGKLDDIANYCSKDVEATRELYKLITEGASYE